MINTEELRKTLKKEKYKKEQIDLYVTEFPAYFNDSDFREAWAGYKEMRLLIKKPMTLRAEKLALNTLLRLGGSSISLAGKILDQSVYKSWQGLFKLQEDVNDEPTGGNRMSSTMAGG